jgi:hypothetical protein
MQLASFTLSIILVAGISVGLEAANRPMLAIMLPLCALSLPIRAYRGTDPRTASPMLRLALSLGTLIAGGVAWLVEPTAIGMALAYGAREWVAAALVLLFFQRKPSTQNPSDEVLRFAEVARNTVINSRRRLAFRLTKNILTVFGPFGNFAARTGRGLLLDRKLEPYMPHHQKGFSIFAALTGVGAIVLVIVSSKPLAAIVSSAMFQLSAIAINILVLWRYLPRRDDPTLIVSDDEDE